MDPKSNSFRPSLPPPPPTPPPVEHTPTLLQTTDKDDASEHEYVLEPRNKEDTGIMNSTTKSESLTDTPDPQLQSPEDPVQNNYGNMELKESNPQPMKDTDTNQVSPVTETDLDRFMSGSSAQPQGNQLQRQNRISDAYDNVTFQKTDTDSGERSLDSGERSVDSGERSMYNSNSEDSMKDLRQKATPAADNQENGLNENQEPEGNGNGINEVVIENELYETRGGRPEGDSPTNNGDGIHKSETESSKDETDRDPDKDTQREVRGNSNEDLEMSSALNDEDEDVVYSVHDLKGDNVSLKHHLLSMWYLILIIVTPIVFLPIFLLVDDEYQREARCGFVIAVMAVFWTTEAMPIAVTSLLPVVLLPSLGVLTARQTSGSYFNDTSMLFVGGLLVAITIEVWDVHKRIALLVLKIVGAEPKCLLLGVTLVTWFLSMWISNTATTAMMMTIVQALLAQFKTLNDQEIAEILNESATGYGTISRQNSTSSNTSNHKKTTGQSLDEYIRLSKALSLTVAYAANIGGIGSLTGTGPNMVLFASAQQVFENQGLTSPISFSTWLVYGLPLSMLVVMVMWLWMVLIFLRCKDGCRCCCCSSSENSEQIERVNKLIHDEYEKLGPVTYAQWSVIISFVLLVLMWITRDLGGVGGWGSWFPPRFVSDSTPSLLMGILMFVLPSTFPSSLTNKCDRRKSYKKVQPLLTWQHVHEKMPWTLYLLLGGGYAIARASTESGLSVWLGEQLLVFRNLDQWGVLLIICYIVTFATEVTSNTAMATLMMPILAQMAISLELNPLFFMFPAAITTSFAFMLPVATPPNAIVFSHGNLRVIDMVLCGFFLNVVSVPLLLMATATWGNAFFGFDQVPAAFINQTLTTVANIVQQ